MSYESPIKQYLGQMQTEIENELIRRARESYEARMDGDTE